jgi:hypothetical protein
LLGEIDEEKEANNSLQEVSLEEILEAQSKQQVAKEEQESILMNLHFSLIFFAIFANLRNFLLNF